MADTSYRALFDLSGKTALITGACGILGRRFAAGLAEFGAALALVDLDAGATAAFAAEIARLELGMPTDGLSWPQLADDLLSKFVEPTLVQPTFVLDYPLELSPFARTHRAQDGLAERWEAFAGGMEIANAFSELTDPDEQRERFDAQLRLAAAGDEETQPHDELFLEALEHGMPPTGGVGVGIDRLVMLLCGRASIREVVLFPAMRN